MKAPIFIMGATKSGTSLLRSLLDGHSSLFVIPTESHFFRTISGDWVAYSRSRPVRRHADDWNDVMASALDQIMEDTNRRGGGHYAYDRARFMDHVRGRETQVPGRQFEEYLSALQYSISGCTPGDNTRIVEKSVENAEFAFPLRTMFPDSSLIHVVRNPYANIVALRKFRMMGRGYPSMAGSIQQLSLSYHQLWLNMRYIPNYIVLKYEDIIMNTRDTMCALCERIGIEYEPCLLAPTVQGKAWQGNSTSCQAFIGLSKAPLSAWMEDITMYERYAVNVVAKPVLEHFGYAYQDASFPWLPNWRESPRAYVMNRLALRLLSDRT
jgi:hypothetical protein